MKKTVLSTFILFCTLGIGAQNLQFLQISDPYSMGIAGDFVTASRSNSAVYKNPAAMSLSSYRLNVGASFGMWQPQYANNMLLSAAGYCRIGSRFAVGAGGRYITYQPYELMEESGASYGTYSPHQYAFDLGASFKIIDGLSVGVTARATAGKMVPYDSFAAFMGDISVMYSAKGFSAAVAAANIGSNMVARAGAAYKLSFAEVNSLGVSISGDYLIKEKGIMAGLGLEYGYNELLFARAGFRYGDSSKAMPSHASVGIGFNFGGFGLNAAYLIPVVPDSPLKNSFNVGISYLLK